jgi:hypothetical protein
MNPEFQRNLWIELPPRRMVMMIVVVGLVLLAAGLSNGNSAIASAAEYLFYGIVVWGSRQAARSVVGEIRDRTWDAQRLSALSPFAMTWGKLLGATIYSWFGGALCLAAIVALAVMEQGANRALGELGYFLSLGLIAQAVALFASLLAVRRAETHPRFNVFLYQLAGLAAAWAAWWAWHHTRADGFSGFDQILWWGQVFPARTFYIISLVAFLAWAIVGCYRLMRVELQWRNTPLVWACFVLFMALYAGGFDGLLLTADVWTVRLLSIVLAMTLLTYGAVLFEPKDPVLYRWLAEKFRQKDKALFARLPGWVVAFPATAIAGLALCAHLATLPALPFGLPPGTIVLVLAGLGFLARDLGVFLYFPLASGGRRGDLSAVVILILLYGVAPQIVDGFNLHAAKVLFWPMSIAPSLIAPLVAWTEAVGMWALVVVAARRSWSEGQTQPLRK